MSANRILDAATKVFAVHGYDKATIKDIALECGLKASSIYSHYSSKEEILLTIWGQINQDISGFLKKYQDQIVAEEDYDEKDLFKRLFLEIFSYLKTDYNKLYLLRRIIHFPPTTIESTKFINEELYSFQRMSDAFYQVFDRLIKKNEVKNTPIHLLIIAYNSMINGLIDYVIAYKKELKQEDVEAVFEIMWQGFVA